MHAKHARSSDLDGSISLCVTVDAFIEFFDTTPNIFVIVNSFIQSNPAFLEWNDKELQVTSTGQVNTAPECIAAGAQISKTVHNFSRDLTLQHTTALARQRDDDATAFIEEVFDQAPNITGFIAPAIPPRTRFLGAQFVTPRPPGCLPGRTIPGCPRPDLSAERRCETDAAY
eukprot:COSAG01_NODE_4132_length_5322_cov_3.930308_3_plen_172_part_00